MVSGRAPQAIARRVISARPRVMSAATVLWPSSQAVANPGGNGDHVFQRSAELHSHQIGVGIDAKPGIAELALHNAGHFRIRRGYGDSGRVAARHFQSEGRTADGRQTGLRNPVCCKTSVITSRHAHQGIVLQALGGADDEHLRPQEGKHLGEQPPSSDATA